MDHFYISLWGPRLKRLVTINHIIEFYIYLKKKYPWYEMQYDDNFKFKLQNHELIKEVLNRQEYDEVSKYIKANLTHEEGLIIEKLIRPFIKIDINPFASHVILSQLMLNEVEGNSIPDKGIISVSVWHGPYSKDYQLNKSEYDNFHYSYREYLQSKIGTRNHSEINTILDEYDEHLHTMMKELIICEISSF
jgi:hypothetical protein